MENLASREFNYCIGKSADCYTRARGRFLYFCRSFSFVRQKKKDIQATKNIKDVSKKSIINFHALRCWLFWVHQIYGIYFYCTSTVRILLKEKKYSLCTQLEDISKFLTPGEYNNLIWFYQKNEEVGGTSMSQDAGDVDRQVSQSVLAPRKGIASTG